MSELIILTSNIHHRDWIIGLIVRFITRRITNVHWYRPHNAIEVDEMFFV